MENKLKAKRPLLELYQLWDQLGDVPLRLSEELDQPFMHFPAGTHREDVWHWFEEQNPRFVVGEVMAGVRHSNDDLAAIGEQIKAGEQTFSVYHLTDTRPDYEQELTHNYALLDARRDATKAAALFRTAAHGVAYTLVAEVRATSLEEVFQLTNSIDQHWWKNSGVQPKFKSAGCRSTSVGDLVVDGSGVGHFCDSIGWTDVQLSPGQQSADRAADSDPSPGM